MAEVTDVNEDFTNIKTALNFYMLANKLKYIPTDKGYNQSVADQVYGSMILATAINSEYNKVDNLGATLRTILFGAINDYYHKELVSCFHNMKKGEEYSREMLEYLIFDGLDYTSGKFAFDCVSTEHSFLYFFEEFLSEENITTQDVGELFVVAKNYGFIDRLGNDEKKNYEIFKFYYLNMKLREKVRSGWDSNHWNISIERIERISEHITGCIALAIAFDSEFDFGIDLDKVISTLCIHEVGEISIGDITPFDGISPEEKLEIEHKAIIDIIGNLTKNKEMINSLFEFDDQQTSDAKFSHYCDKLEADLQAKIYQDMGFQHPLTEQENNVVFKSSKVQKMLEDGATSAFDIWYEWDKSIYTDSPVFTKTLKYVKNNKISNNYGGTKNDSSN